MKIISNLPDTDAGTTERPDGALADVSAPAAGDGTPAREDWMNDLFYAFLAVMNDVGVSADDTDEEVELGTGASQFLDAIRLIGSIDMQTKNANFVLTDADIPRYHTHFDVTTAAATITATLPAPSATNTGKRVTLYKIDSGAGIIRGTASFQHLGTNQATIDIEILGTGITFISNGTKWLVDRGIGLEVELIGSTLESVYTKFFSGTLDADASTEIAHGVDFDKITGASIFAYDDDVGGYRIAAPLSAEVAINAVRYEIRSSAITFNTVGTRVQGNNYRATIWYYI